MPCSATTRGGVLPSLEGAGIHQALTFTGGSPLGPGRLGKKTNLKPCFLLKASQLCTSTHMCIYIYEIYAYDSKKETAKY